MRLLLVIMIVVSMVALVGCGGKKTRPLEEQEQQVTEPGERVPGEGEEPGGEEPIRPIQPDEAEDLILKTIYFDYDKYNLTSQSTAALAENAALLLDNPSLRILIEGHCDERGTDDYNLALGEKRALAARDYLVNFGIPKSRISVISYGEERPADPASNEEAWARNRRGEFVIK